MLDLLLLFSILLWDVVEVSGFIIIIALLYLIYKEVKKIEK